MANSVGALTVTLGLDAAEYTRGLTKAEYQAQQFARNTRTAILEVGKAFAGLAIADTVIQSTKAIIAEAAALDDLASATGSSVEALSKLNNQAKISGTEFATLQSALLKLSGGMAGTDAETTKAKEALKLLGITTRDPAQALQEVAVKLNTYADGVNKVGIAVALFGKQGAALLPMLKDMAELQDVQATTTTKQAAEAAALEKAWRSLSVESATFKNAILSDVVPALLTMIEDFKEGIRVAGDFWSALRLFGTLSPFDTPAEGIEKLSKNIEQMQARMAKGRAFDWFNELPGKIADASKQLEFLSNKQARLQLRDPALRAQEDRGFDPRKPAPALPGGDRTRALKEQTTEAQRYLETLEKQNERTLELTHTEQFLRDIQLDRIKGLTPALTDQILKQTQLLDSTEALKKAEVERKKAAEEAAKAEQRINEATNHAIKSAMQEVESIKQGNEQLREQIAFLKGGQEAVDAMAAAKLGDAIATEEARLAALKWGEANELWVKAVEDQVRVLKERQQLIGDKRAAEAAAKEAEKAKQFADELGKSLAQGAENAILHFNNLRDTLKSLEQDLLRIITRKLVTAPLGDFLSSAIGAGISGFSMPAFASGGTSAGGWATVGEQGPEAVYLPRGAQVIPNDVLTSKRSARNVTVNINVPAGATRSTIDQTRLQFGMELQRVMDRSG